jgi:hypothetical protein
MDANNSLGCVPFVSSSGFASVTSTNPFLVMANDCLPNQVGFLHYGYAPSNLSFHGGTLCDLNKRIQSGVDPMLTAGAQVYAQWRQRDPSDPAGFGENLANGLTFVVRP